MQYKEIGLSHGFTVAKGGHRWFWTAPNGQMSGISYYSAREAWQRCCGENRLTELAQPGLPVLPVVFRVEGSKSDPSVVAVFPTQVGKDWRDFAVYAHIGQHSTGSIDWYRTTKRAKPGRYLYLLEELRGIYERGDDPVRLVVRDRMTAEMTAQRRQSWHDMENAAHSMQRA